MFKKKKKDIKVIKILRDNNIIYDGDIYGLPIKDEEVIAGSIEFFNDPEPCMIHRSAVISRYYMRIENWFDGVQTADNATIDINHIPYDVVKLLDI